MIRQADVASFHEKHGFKREPLGKGEELIASFFDDIIASLSSLAIRTERLGLEFEPTTSRMYRVHLMIEELTEVVNAIKNADEIDLADGLADLVYVILGTADTYNIPLEHVFNEVHRSNMTKRVRDKSDDPRMRDKGPDYTPPDVEGAIKKGRES